MSLLDRRTFLFAPSLLAATKAQGATDQFVPLFDGKTLKGWIIEEGPESAFYVKDGAIVAYSGASSPTWLRSERQYENFNLQGEFFVKGWTDSGIYIHAPEHGRPSWTGMQIKIFHQREETMTPQSMGSVFPLVPPLKINVSEGWNDFRILMDWPSLRVWTNGEIVQDLDVESIPDLSHRLRCGYIGIPTVSAECRFRNLRIHELPPRERWTALYEDERDFEKWFVSEKDPKFQTLGQVLRADGLGHIATREQFKDFELHLYIRASRAHNGGVLFRSAGKGLSDPRHYEIQLHNVEEAHFPTGSLYYFKRAVFPRIEDEKWYLMQLIVQGKSCLVRINGENVLEYDALENLGEGHIELQAHRTGYWTEYKHIRIKPL